MKEDKSFAEYRLNVKKRVCSKNSSPFIETVESADESAETMLSHFSRQFIQDTLSEALGLYVVI